VLTLARGRLREQTGLQRRALSTGWQMLGTAPAQFADPSQLPPASVEPGDHQGVRPIASAEAQVWLDVLELGPVAEVLRQTGRWSLDAEPRRFDAQDWWYRLSFDADVLRSSHGAWLEFDGLATLAEVWLNGEAILHSTNMFMAHRLDVASRLKAVGNELVLAFRSLDQALTKRRPRPRWRAPMIENQQLRWFRTTLLGRTPGWSPPAAVVGPWRSIALSQRALVDMTDLAIQPSLQGGVGVMAMRCGLQALGGGQGSERVEATAGLAIESVVLRLTRDGRAHEQPLTFQDDGRWAGVMSVPDVAVWWPHTHGEAALYGLSLLVRVCRPSGVIDEITLCFGHTGFRHIELDRSDDGFALKLNGVPVFCRGACWTPLDIVTLDAASPQAYADAIGQVREAGMNMIRVGGTMAYEADAFHDECDRQGILVWQEFMFANMDYPEDAGFTAMAQAEARQQLARWQGRPSLAVLCGNSEVEQQAAMFGATRERWSPALFHDILAHEAEAACPDVPYWPSSAHGGSFPHQGDVGTTSYYGVGAYQRGLDDARRASVRFATECLAFSNAPEQAAMARMPGGLSLRMHHPAWKTRAPRDLGAGWDFEDVRDHYVAQLFGVDPARLRYSDHERYLTLGRVAVGEAMSATFAEWRRPASACRGALIWFLRDLWPGAGWGVVDSLGHPKAPLYYLRRALQPVSIAMTDEGGNGMYVHVVNETDRPLQAEVEFTALQHGQTQVAQGRRSMELKARGASTQALMTWFDWFADWSFAYRFGPASAQVLVATLTSAEGKLLGRSFAFPTGHNLAMERDLGLWAVARATDAGVFEVTVGTERFAQAVHFDVDGFVPDDAYFHLIPGATQTVVFRAAVSATSPTARAASPAGLSGTVRALNGEAAVNIRLEAGDPLVLASQRN
jgi:beta-mannosidase